MKCSSVLYSGAAIQHSYEYESSLPRQQAPPTQGKDRAIITNTDYLRGYAEPDNTFTSGSFRAIIRTELRELLRKVGYTPLFCLPETFFFALEQIDVVFIKPSGRSMAYEERISSGYRTTNCRKGFTPRSGHGNRCYRPACCIPQKFRRRRECPHRSRQER